MKTGVARSVHVITLLICGLIPVLHAQAKGGEAMELRSDAFVQGTMIPAEYTCDGQDISPPLSWMGLPAGTSSVALICDDPDAPAGTWVHWVYYDIPPRILLLEQDIGPDDTPSAGGIQGKNDFGRIGYGGPCPPSGTHRYFFRLYALDTELNLDPGRTKKQLLDAMKGHIIGQAELMGKYKRR